jgi:ATP-dependent 26S proteasome regulatory subunit
MKKAAVIAVPWEKRNQQLLVREFAELRRRLGGDATPDVVEADGELARMDPPAAIDALAATFGLSQFERALLLLLAGVEMDPALGTQCAEAAGGLQRAGVTFGMGMAFLPEPHWSALAPSGPLRRYRLIEMEHGHGLTSAPLRVDERVLHYLAGVNRLDERLEGMLQSKPLPQWMAGEHLQLAAGEIGSFDRDEHAQTVLHLCGDDAAAQENVAALIAHRAGCELYVLRMEDTPAPGAEMDQFMHLWTRESMLLPAMLLLQWEHEAPTAAARQLAERVQQGLMIASRDSVRLHRPLTRYEVDKPGPAGQLRLWKEAIGEIPDELEPVLSEIAEQYRLSAETIVGIVQSVGSTAAEVTVEESGERLWETCRMHSRPKLEAMAERIVPRATWEDLVLPEMQMQALRQLASQARHRMTVYEEWGFAERGRRGLGLSVLFSGPSGTGKTLAAEVLASELKLDLYRIDLSSVVSKYIGETEKNLKQVFDAAESGGVILLFDEADALFGKRAEVKDSHDRYANIEVGYLLQRMESFQGLAVLTTNFKSSLDKAFQRRLRFSVDFPFPDVVQREAIWSRVFPDKTPKHELAPARLAALNMAGGNIRNIALNAAFLAADAEEAVGMGHILEAAKLEALKVERPISESETRGWVGGRS